MKKNKMMRIASVLLVAVLLSTCAISGTFAKYVTTASGNDTARVAKWGVTLAIAGANFSTEYAKHDNTATLTPTDDGMSVKSSNTEKVVAPGTGSADVSGDVKLSIAGEPEVAVAVAVAFSDDSKDVFLKAGTYRDWTVSDPSATFVLENDYYPIVWTLTKYESDGTTVAFTTSGTLEQIKAYVATYTSTAKYAPNEDITSSYKLTWAWAFESGNDKADTLLGNIAAGKETTVAAANYSIGVKYDVTVTATQID